MRRWLVAPVILAFVVLCLPSRAWAEPTSRAVYVTVVDDHGQPVTGLTAADFALKEGGKDREIASVEPARTKMHIAVMIEETLTPMGGVRNALGEFVKRMYQVAEISFIIVGQRNTTAVDYTSDPNALITGINNLSLSQQQTQTMVPEGIFDLTKVLEKDKPERPVIVLLALEKQQTSAEQPQNVLNQLARSGAMMYVVSMEGGSASSGTSGIGRASADNGAMDMAGRAQVMGDGPKQSGGRRVEVAALTAFPTGIQQIADDLSSQYLIKYTLPDGVKPSDRLNVSLKKKGVTLRAPTKISNK
jgi:VWFA-related protein